MITSKIYSKGVLSILGMTILALVFTSCIDKFEDYNTNENEATDEMMDWDGLRVGSRFRQMQRNIIIFNDGNNADSDYQIAQNLSHDIYSGYMSPTIATNNGIHNGTYSFIENWYQLFFNNAYTNIMQPWATIAQEHEKNDLPNEMALANILKVLGMHRVADTYGPIPYANFTLGSLDNDYDDMATIYESFFEELDDAISTLSELQVTNPGDKFLERFDMVYGGDTEKWLKLANTLRLRLAVRVSYVNPTLAQQQVDAVMSNAYGLITTASERAAIQHSSVNYYHPVYEIAYNFNSGDVRPGAAIISYMNGFSDPRRAAYFTQATGGNYYGVRLGIEQPSWDVYKGSNISNFNITPATTEIVWVTAAESYFLLAELAQRGMISGSAKDYYEEGIKMSFSENGVTGAETYIANSTGSPTGFVDNSGRSQSITGMGTSGIPNSVNFDNITVAWANDGMELARIVTQKWIAVYPDGVEGWSEYRRTGMPYLFPPLINSNSGTISSTLQVRRLPYPRTEYDTNNEKVNAAVSSLLGGADNGGTPLWWDTRR